jgi:hypothetical protein
MTMCKRDRRVKTFLFRVSRIVVSIRKWQWLEVEHYWETLFFTDREYIH